MIRAVRILIDMVHPAHVHFFRPLLARLKERGHELFVTSRDKDCTLDLLDAFRISHLPLTRAAKSKWGLAREMVLRDARLIGAMKRFKPDLVLGKEAACAHQAAWLLGVPSLAVDDTDDASWQRRLSLPFATRVAADPAARVSRSHLPVPGVSALTYLHPRRFSPPTEVSDSILVRLVRWESSHDLGEGGFAEKSLTTLVKGLSRFGMVKISSERRLPEKLRPYLIEIAPEQLHQWMASCRLYVGESATMAAECAVLGVPAIYCSTRELWYTRLLEQRGLLSHVRSTKLALKAAAIWAGMPRAELRSRRDAYLAEVGDPVERWVQIIESNRRSKAGSH